uniref:L27-1 domain-containing protein n=1 Tax=Terrapene triunguis TaxID=2587831 RepID=A0A674JP55_9SAUR
IPVTESTYEFHSLKKPEEQQLKKAIKKVMGIFKSSLFQALIGRYLCTMLYLLQLDLCFWMLRAYGCVHYLHLG